MENWPILTYYNDIYNGKHFAIFSKQYFWYFAMFSVNMVINEVTKGK